MLFRKFWSLSEIVVWIALLSVLSAMSLSITLAWHWLIYFRRSVILLALIHRRIFWITWIYLPTADYLPMLAALRWSVNKIVYFCVYIVISLNSTAFPWITSRLGLLLTFFFILVGKYPQRVFNVFWLYGIIWIILFLVFVHRLELFVILICCCRYIAPSVFTLFVIGRPLRLDLLTRNV